MMRSPRAHLFVFATVLLTLAPHLCASEDSVAKKRAIERLDALGLEQSGTSLVHAIAAGNQPVTKLLLAAGVEVNAADTHQCSPLIAATSAKDWPLVARLISAGADVRHVDDTGFTPLMAAAAGGNLPLVQDLLSRGADPAAADHGGHTALHFAISSRDPVLVERLLQTNQPLLTDSSDDGDLAARAFKTRDLRIINAVLARTPPLGHWSDAACATLNAALASQDTDFAKFLISKHTVPPTPVENGQPYLAYAVGRNDLDLLQTLLDCGADPNVTLDAPDDSEFRNLIKQSAVHYYLDKTPGITPLMVAAGCGHADHVKLLLDHGANRTQYTKGKMELLALYFAAWADCPEAVQLLVGGTPPTRDELHVEVSLSHQRATVLKDGSPIFSTEISSGMSGKPTPVGEFIITDKNLEHHSTIYHNASMPFFMRLSCRDFGMHEGYVTGHPASHGCIRLPGAAARRLFKELPIGTWVSVSR